MNAKLDYKNLKAWPFIEALKVFKDIENRGLKKLSTLKQAMDPPEFLILEPLLKF